METEIRDLRKSKAQLLERKNKQLGAKRWLKHKNNQKRYAVQQSKVRKQASELTNKKFRKAALNQPLPMHSVIFYPIMLRASKRNDLKLEEIIYLAYTWNFMFLSLTDYKEYFGDTFKMSCVNKCREKGYLDVHKTSINQYYLSFKGKNLIKSLIEEFKELKDAEA